MRFLGPHACEEALERGELQTLRIAPGAWERCAKLRLAARERGVVVHREPMDSLDRRSQGQRHQGVLGEGETVALASLESLLERVCARGPQALVLALDGISDPHNFGAILRSEDHVEPLIGGAKSAGFSGGFGYRMLGGELDFGYQYRQAQDVDTRHLNGSWTNVGYAPVPLSTTRVEGMGHLWSVGFKRMF